MPQTESVMQEKPFILIVDDISTNLQVLGGILSSEHYQFTPATTGKHALKIIEKKIPDLILLDIMMPEMDGFEVCRSLRDNDATKDIPVIFISALTNVEDKVKGFKAGGVDYITKPFQKEEVLARVSTHLKLKYTHEKLKQINDELNIEIKERKQTEALLKDANQKITNQLRYITDSIQYAGMIQKSLLPNPDEIKKKLPDSFILWIPRDIVSGDIFFVEFFESTLNTQHPSDDFIIAVIDCTGHGIPGAFMTMIASSGLRRIIRDDGCRNPAEILKQLNFIVKTTLHQDTSHASSDDGMDAAIVYVEYSTPDSPPILTFAGARLPLLWVHNNEINVIKGDRQSLGYKHSKRSDINFTFTNHTLLIEKGMCFYIKTDGYTDQGDGKDNRHFGIRRFRELLKHNARLPFETQHDILIQTFDAYKGDAERTDDVTVVGFSI